jgi:hypothetical protein
MPIEYESGWSLELVWVFEEEKNLPLSEIETLIVQPTD